METPIPAHEIRTMGNNPFQRRSVAGTALYWPVLTDAEQPETRSGQLPQDFLKLVPKTPRTGRSPKEHVIEKKPALSPDGDSGHIGIEGGGTFEYDDQKASEKVRIGSPLRPTSSSMPACACGTG
jgi:hypothetical protein